MPRNHSFRFKQFSVQQDQCAMKVCTDACVLGAWARVDGHQVLDIGAGTGLLSLMVAQRTPGTRIDAIELDEAAAQQARDNVAASPFAERIRVIHTPIQRYRPEALYDCIITNPPFFQADLRSPDAGVNQAHHAQNLSFEELLMAIDRLLKKKTGVWNVLLPVEESDQLQQLAEAKGWVPGRQLLLTHQPGRKPFRMLSTYVHNERGAVTNMKKELFIYETDGKTHSPEFRELLKEFYIIF